MKIKMPNINWPVVLTVGLLAMGAAGLAGVGRFAPAAGWLLAGGLAVGGSFIATGHAWPKPDGRPRPLRLGPADYLKAAVCWAAAFHRSYAFAPGVYYTGEYDPRAPLLVTANYHLTVFLVARQLRGRNARLLIVDTDGINVWYSAGKGQFNAWQVLAALDGYAPEVLSAGPKIELVLPKFALAGVNRAVLRTAGIRPVIGPLYAHDLPAYLDAPPYADCDRDQVRFGLASRLFTWLPGMVQFAYYALYLVAARALLGSSRMDWGLLGLIALVVTAYPLLFPWLPGRRFAVKGLSLAGALALGLAALWGAASLGPHQFGVALFFAAGTSVFFALSYTGNSAVSNYSRVRLEIARFLPVAVALYAASLVLWLAF